MLIKRGLLQLHDLSPQPGSGVWGLVEASFRVLFNPWVFSGLSSYVISVASLLYVLSKIELSYAYPFLALSNVVIALAAWWFYSEDLNLWRIAGIGMICIGTALIAHGGSWEIKPETQQDAAAPSPFDLSLMHDQTRKET
nr:EamA family transporter [uncultured Cohaesibacter sp.]